MYKRQDIHINSFQLGADAADPDGYYVTGDWHDVFYRPSTVTAGKIYFSVDRHTGKAVLHCHFLEHEDKGCMAGAAYKLNAVDPHSLKAAPGFNP